MNKIITANINGFIFPIDEIAYEKLQIYLKALHQKISDHETVTDIENRIAELFNIQIQSGKMAILENDLKEVIAQIGDVSEFDDHAERESFNDSVPSSHTKSFYRDKENKQLFGVCSGLAAYTQIDVRIIRIIFVLLFWFGFGLIVYFVIALLTPYAQTDGQRAEMHQNPVDYQNFKSTAKESFNSMKNEIKNQQNSKTIKLLATIALVGLVVLLIPSIFTIIFSAGVISLFLETVQRYILLDFQNILYPVIASIFIVVIPLILVFYRLIRIVFEGQKMPKYLKIGLNSIWIISFFYMLYLSINLGRSFGSSYSISTTVYPNNPSKDSTIYVKSNALTVQQQNREYTIEDPDLEYFLGQKFSENIELNIYTTTQKQPYLSINKYSRGTRTSAIQNVNGMNYHFEFESNQLTLNHYFNLDAHTPWRVQKITASLFIPIGNTVMIDKSCSSMIQEVDNQELGLDWDGTENARLKSTTSGMIFIK